MERKSSKVLIPLILNAIRDEPKSIHEIANETNSNWESVKSYLESLKDAGILKESERGNKRLFYLSIGNIKKRSDTYFGLPLKEELSKKIDSLFFHIKKEWKSKTGKEPKKTQVQKVLVKVNGLCKLKIPMGWYLYGCFCVKPYDTSYEYNYNPLENEKEVIACVKTVVNDYSQEESVYKLKLKQYQDEHKDMYLIKEAILTILTFRELKSSIDELNSMFFKLLSNIPEIDDKDSKDMINESIGTILNLVYKLDEKVLKKIRLDIIESFNTLWKLITLYQFSNDLKEYYDTETIKNCLYEDIILQKINVQISLEYILDLIPLDEEPKEENYIYLRNMIRNIKLLSDKEKKMREKELEGKDSTYILRKFGLD